MILDVSFEFFWTRCSEVCEHSQEQYLSIEQSSPHLGGNWLWVCTNVTAEPPEGEHFSGSFRWTIISGFSGKPKSWVQGGIDYANIIAGKCRRGCDERWYSMKPRTTESTHGHQWLPSASAVICNLVRDWAISPRSGMAALIPATRCLLSACGGLFCERTLRLWCQVRLQWTAKRVSMSLSFQRHVLIGLYLSLKWLTTPISPASLTPPPANPRIKVWTKQDTYHFSTSDTLLAPQKTQTVLGSRLIQCRKWYKMHQNARHC